MSKGNAMGARCHKSHKPLKIGKYQIQGGSCSDPVDKLDAYVGLDNYMPTWEESWPWTDGYAFCYPITDYAAPDNPASFKKLIDWLEEHLKAGWKIHVGCMGGHGRTGTVFSALVAQMLKEKDATTYVRKHYCEKAVESIAQINFLHKHFGVTKVKGSKTYTDLKKRKDTYPSGKQFAFDDYDFDSVTSRYFPLDKDIEARVEETKGRVKYSTKKLVVKPQNAVGRITLDK